MLPHDRIDLCADQICWDYTATESEKLVLVCRLPISHFAGDSHPAQLKGVALSRLWVTLFLVARKPSMEKNIATSYNYDFLAR